MQCRRLFEEVGGKGLDGNSVLSAQFCCESKTPLKYKINFLKDNVNLKYFSSSYECKPQNFS